MTTEISADGCGSTQPAQTVNEMWVERDRNKPDPYPYNDIQILVNVRDQYEQDYEHLEVYTRLDLHSSSAAPARTPSSALGRATTKQLVRVKLREGVDFAVLHEDWWTKMDPEVVELEARIAQSFGLSDLAADARWEIQICTK